MNRFAPWKNFVLFSFFVMLTRATPYEDCGSMDQVVSFIISDCDSPPCIVPRPSVYDVNITFTANVASENLYTKIIAQVGDESVPWPAPNGCEQLIGPQCPIQVGETYFYSTTMQVLKEYPSTTAVVTWKLVDENDVDHVCTIVPVTVV